MTLHKEVYKHSWRVFSWLYRSATFLAVVGLFALVYFALFEQFADGSKRLLPLLAVWLFSAYIVIPKVHRFLTRFYLPDYYVGRIRSPAGFLSDPINLALFGSARDIHAAMKKAGWEKADPLTPYTFIRTVYCVILRRSYPTAPVGHMYLFSRVQNFAYQQQVNGSPAERHHIRFWKTPNKKWRLPGGHEAQWLAAATYDTRLGFKFATGQIDHLIRENIDEERDFVVSTLKEARTTDKLEVIEHFTDAYHTRNNGGDRITTDGALPFIYLKPTE